MPERPTAPNAPYMGGAPEPQRKLDLNSMQITDNTSAPMQAPTAPAPAQRAPSIGSEFAVENADFGPPQPGAVLSEGMLRETPPPANPEETATLASLQETVGQLIQHVGTLQERHAQELAEQDLQHQLALLQSGRNGGGIKPPALFDGDPNESLTRGQLQAFVLEAQQQQAMLMAQQTRATWGITQQQEYEIISRFPALQQIPEPQKTALIQQYAAKLYKPVAPRAASPSAGAPNAPTLTPSTRQVVPHVEARTAPAAPDMVRGPDNAAAATAEYERAKQIKDPKQRIAALRAITDKIIQLKGGNTEDFVKGGFVSKS